MPAPVPMVVPAVSSCARVMRRTWTAGAIELPSHGRVKARMKAKAKAKRRVKPQAKAQARVWRRGVHCRTGKSSSIAVVRFADIASCGQKFWRYVASQVALLTGVRLFPDGSPSAKQVLQQAGRLAGEGAG